MCGITGIFYKRRDDGPIGHAMVDMCDQVFRRGPDSAGVALYGRLSDGFVVRVDLDRPDLDDAAAEVGIAADQATALRGHTRMATESIVDIAHSHPFWARPFPDISVVHNGQITNYHKLRRRLEQKGHRFATGNDSEVIAVYIADKLEAGESLDTALRASIDDLDSTSCSP